MVRCLTVTQILVGSIPINPPGSVAENYMEQDLIARMRVNNLVVSQAFVIGSPCKRIRLMTANKPMSKATYGMKVIFFREKTCW